MKKQNKKEIYRACRNCRFWGCNLNGSSKDERCYRYAPRPYSQDPKGVSWQQWEWPHTIPEDICGEWQPTAYMLQEHPELNEANPPKEPGSVRIKPELLDTTQATAMLGVTKQQLYRLMGTNSMPQPIQLLDEPNGLRFHRLTLRAWLNAGCPNVSETGWKYSSVSNKSEDKS